MRILPRIMASFFLLNETNSQRLIFSELYLKKTNTLAYEPQEVIQMKFIVDEVNFRRS